jgi:riboflavin synthase
MFTGIVDARGEIKCLEPRNGFKRIRIVSTLDLLDVVEGDSIAVDGACLTVTEVKPSSNEFSADVSPETSGVTTLRDLKVGARVNLEKAMRLGARLGGHLVLGHVDCVGRIIEKRPQGQGVSIGFHVDSDRYLVEKGSVAIDGISLTLNRVDDCRFWVMVIPHTALMTGLTQKCVNDSVNVEFDLIGKYVEKFMTSARKTTGLNENTLKEYGFM